MLVAAACLLGAALVAGCVATPGDEEIFGTATGGTVTPGVIKQAGSSTVEPLAKVWADEFGSARGVQVDVGSGGSGKGESGLCSRELDIADMSRPMKDSARDGACRDHGVDPVEWTVAFDGLSVVVGKKNTFVQALTVEQLSHIFRADGPATRWDQVDPGFPAKAIRLCYPGDDSGTYEYFNEAVLDGGEPRKGSGVQQSEDDNVLVTCLQNDPEAIGYFGFAYVQHNTDKVRPIRVDGVAPTFESIADGSYTPLSRPLYLYTDGVPEGVLADYLGYVYHAEGGQRLIQDVGYVALDEATRLAMLHQLDR